MNGNFTVKQQRFIDFYEGNATDAARKAGYKGNESTLTTMANKLMTKGDILEAVKARETKCNEKLIANREKRQEFWTSIMNSTDKDVHVRDKLKASELLGRSQGDFIENSKSNDTVYFYTFDEVKKPDDAGL